MSVMPPPSTASTVTTTTSPENQSHTTFPIWVPPAQYEGQDPELAHISKSNLLTGKSHRNRLRESQAFLSNEILEWTRFILKRNIMAPDCFAAFANGELLCAIINTVCPFEPTIPITFGAPVKSAEARAHVGAFLRTATRLGVQPHHLFKPKDLMKRANDRRVMRTLLYFVLTLIRYGLMPIPVLVPRIMHICTSTGYAVPEVILVGHHCLGRFGTSYVKSPNNSSRRTTGTRAIATSSSSTSSTSFIHLQESAQDRAARLERERHDREQHAAEFRPQLHFMGGNKRKKQLPASAKLPPLTDHALSSIQSEATVDPHATNLSSDGSSAFHATRPEFADPATAAGVASSTSSPHRLRATASMDFRPIPPAVALGLGPPQNDGESNIGILSHDSNGVPFPSFPHPTGERFEFALQNMDLNDLLLSETDETDIDKPMMAALLFPAFGDIAPDQGPITNGKGMKAGDAHGAWNRNEAELHVRVEPIKFAMFTSRHPLKSFAVVFGLWILSIILLFGPYPRPFMVDLSTTSFFAIGDKYTSYNHQYKAAVQSSWQYAQQDKSTLILFGNDENQPLTQQHQSNPIQRHKNPSSPLSSSSSSSSSSPSSLTHSLVFDLLEHHDRVVSTNRDAAILTGTYDAITPHRTDDSWMDTLTKELLHAAAGGTDIHQRWQNRTMDKFLASLRRDDTHSSEEEADATLSVESHPMSRHLSSVVHLTASQLATSLSVLYFTTASFLDGGNLLTPERLLAIKDFEVSLATNDVYRSYCLKNPTQGTGLAPAATSLSSLTGRYTNCEFPDSAINYFAARLDLTNGVMYTDGANSTAIHSIPTISALMLNWGRTGFFDRGFTLANGATAVETNHAISTFSFGVPLPQYVDGQDTTSWDNDQQISWIQNKVLDTYIDLISGRRIGLFNEIQMAVDGPGVQLRILRDIIFNHDVKLIIGAIFAVIIYAVFHIRSLFLVVGAMCQILFSFFITAFFYRVIFRETTLNILHILCLFVVLALGTNDAFVLWDTFWHSSLLRLRVELPIDRVVRKKHQEERDYARRQEDLSFHGWCMRWWYDVSGCHPFWRRLKSCIPCFNVTDFDLNQHFETGVEHSNPLGPNKTVKPGAIGSATNSGVGIGHFAHSPTSQQMSAFSEGGAGVPNPLASGSPSPRPGAAAASAQPTPPADMDMNPNALPNQRRHRHKRIGSSIESQSSTPTRIEKDSDGEDDEYGGLPGNSRENQSLPGLPGPRAQHKRLGSQESNPVARDLAEPEDETSFPVTQPNDLFATRQLSKPSENPVHEEPRPINGHDSATFFPSANGPRGPPPPGTRQLGFVTDAPPGVRGPLSLDADHQRQNQMLVHVQRLDGIELDDEDEAANLEAMASRNGGLKSAIKRKQADRLALRLSWTYRRAVPSMLVTNCTIIIALYAIAASSIGPIKAFGIFMGTIALINFMLSLTFLPTLMIIQYMYFRSCTIIPRAWWNRIKQLTNQFNETVHAGDVKYDDAILEEDEETAANKAAAGLGPGLVPSPKAAPFGSMNSNDPTHVHVSAFGNNPSSPRNGESKDLPSQRVTVRTVGISPRHDLSGGVGLGGALDEEMLQDGNEVRGGVNFVKPYPDEGKPDEMKQNHSHDLTDAATKTEPTAAGAAKPHRPNPSPRVDGQLQKQGLQNRLDAERSKANNSLEKSRRNQFLLFLNALIFRFRFLLIFCWIIILAFCLSQAVKLKVPQTIITILPPSSNLELLKTAYSQLPSCKGCTYEFDRVEHQVIPWASSLPITADARTTSQNSGAQGGDATVSTQSRKSRHVEVESIGHSESHTHAHEGVSFSSTHDASSSQLTSSTVFSPRPSTRVVTHIGDLPTTPAEVLHPTELIEAHLKQAHRWQTHSDLMQSRAVTPVRTVKDMFRSRRGHSAVEFATSSTVDFLTSNLDLPSPPPFVFVHDVSFNSFRLTFAQSLFAGLSPIISYTAIIQPVTSSTGNPTSNSFSTVQPLCSPSTSAQVTKMVLTLRPQLAQSSLSSLTACTASNASSTCFTTSNSLPAVTLGSDWFSSATIQGGANTVGVTYTADGSLKQDLSGLVHGSTYQITMYANSLLGSSQASGPAEFTTLDATPPKPIIRTSSLEKSSYFYADASGDLNPTWFLHFTISINYVATPTLPLPSTVTLFWETSPTSSPLPALPVDGLTSSIQVSLASLTAACTADLDCHITLPEVNTTQFRGGYSHRFWAVSTNQHATGSSSDAVTLIPPNQLPFAPVLLGYVTDPSIPNWSFSTPIIRVYFQLPCLNAGSVSTTSAFLQGVKFELLYHQNTGLVQESDMLLSIPIDYAHVQQSDASAFPIGALAPVLPIPDAPILQLDIGPSNGVALQPNMVYQLRMKVYVDSDINQISSASNVILASTVTAPLLAPTLIGLDYSSSLQQLTVTLQPPTAPTVDPAPAYTFSLLMTLINPPTICSSGTGTFASTFGNTTCYSIYTTTSNSLTVNNVASNQKYYIALVSSTSYARSIEHSPIQCFFTAPGNLMIGTTAVPSLSSCPSALWNNLCLSNFDFSVSSCEPKKATRQTPVDQMFIYQQPSSATTSSFTATRRFQMSNTDGTKSLLINSVTSVPLQPLATFTSPTDSSISCLGATGYDLYSTIPSSCYVPCLTQHCHSVCGQISFDVETHPVSGSATQLSPLQTRSAAYFAETAILDATLQPHGVETNFVVIVKPQTNLDAGIYSCGFNFAADVTDATGGVQSRLMYPEVGVDSGIQAPFDLIISLRVLPLDRPAPITSISYANIVNGEIPAKNISFLIPYAPAAHPICYFELRYHPVNAPDNVTPLYLPTTTASEGFTLNTLLYNTIDMTFSIRAWNSIGALDFAAEVHTTDCAALNTCSSSGSCFTPLYLNATHSRGIINGQQENDTKYPILLNLYNHDVATDPPVYYVGQPTCQCYSGSYGTQCNYGCPSGFNSDSATSDSACSARGVCDSTFHNCSCNYGYGGDACQIECPSSCNSRGTCGVDPLAPELGIHCMCVDGWGGADCSKYCPTYGATGIACSGFGTCSYNVTCVCDRQHRGPTCELLCPGSYTTSDGTQTVCNGRGTCLYIPLHAPGILDVHCLCDAAGDKSVDCSQTLNTGTTTATLVNIPLVHYTGLPTSPYGLPAFSFPIIHVVWGVIGYSPSTNYGGVSSATDTGADGTRSISVATSTSVGTPNFQLFFDITHVDVQQYLRTVCDLIFVSRLIRESYSKCIMTEFETWTKRPSNIYSDGSFPLYPANVIRNWIYFLDSLEGDNTIWRQHVGFQFSTTRFWTLPTTMGQTHDTPEPVTQTTKEHQQPQPRVTIHDFQRSYEEKREAEREQATQDHATWFSSTFMPHLSTTADETASDQHTPIFINYHQLSYLINHPSNGRDFRIVFQGEPEFDGPTSPVVEAYDRARKDSVTPTVYVKICFIAYEFYGTFVGTDTSASYQRQFADAWDDLVTNYINAYQPSTVSPRLGTAFHAADVWAAMSQQLAFKAGVSNGFVIMFVFIFFFIVLFTGGNVRLAMIIIISILSIVCVLFAILASSNGNLGVIEYISAQIVIALSVFFFLYIGHAYIVSPFNTRFGRTRHGLLEWGASVFSAGMAMMLSAFVLNFATITVLSTMGEILCVMTIIIMLFVLTFFIPLLQSIGPMGFDPKAFEKAKAKLAAKLGINITQHGSNAVIITNNEVNGASGLNQSNSGSGEHRPNRRFFPSNVSGPVLVPNSNLGVTQPALGEIGGFPAGNSVDETPTKSKPLSPDEQLQKDRERVQAAIAEREGQRNKRASGDLESTTGLKGGGAFGVKKTTNESSSTPAPTVAIEMSTLTEKPTMTQTTTITSVNNEVVGGPSRHERKPGGTVPNPIKKLNGVKTNSGNLQLSESEDEEDQMLPKLARPSSNMDPVSPKNRRSSGGPLAPIVGSPSNRTTLPSELRSALPPLKKTPSLEASTLPSPSATTSSILATPVPISPGLSRPLSIASPSAQTSALNENLDPSPSGSLHPSPTPSPPASMKVKKKTRHANKPSTGEVTGDEFLSSPASSPSHSDTSLNSDVITTTSPASGTGEQRKRKKKPSRDSTNYPRSISINDEDAQLLSTPSKPLNTNQPTVLIHTPNDGAASPPINRSPSVPTTISAPFVGKSKPPMTVKVSLESPATTTATSSFDDSNDWDREPEVKLPSRMGIKSDTGFDEKPQTVTSPSLTRLPSKPPLPPMTLSRPLSTTAATGLTPLAPLTAPNVSGLKPLGGGSVPKLPLRASLPQSRRRQDEDDDELELDISEDDSSKPVNAGPRSGAISTKQLNPSVEVEIDWDS